VVARGREEAEVLDGGSGESRVTARGGPQPDEGREASECRGAGRDQGASEGRGAGGDQGASEGKGAGGD